MTIRVGGALVILALAAGAVVGIASIVRGSQPERPLDASWLVGTRLEDVRLADAAGLATPISSSVKPAGGVVVVMREQDRLTCADFPLELRILEHRFPHLGLAIVGSGDTAALGEFFRKQRIQRLARLDPEESLLRSLGTNVPTPLVLVLDSTRTVLFADSRSGPVASRMPLGRLLPQLACALRPGTECTG